MGSSSWYDGGRDSGNRYSDHSCAPTSTALMEKALAGREASNKAQMCQHLPHARQKWCAAPLAGSSRGMKRQTPRPGQVEGWVMH